MEDTLPASENLVHSLTYSEVPRERLRALVARQGPLFLNSLHAEATLRAVCHGCEREASLLVAALRADIPARILAAPAMPTIIFGDDLAERMRLAPDAAAWAVESWAYALNGLSETLTDLRRTALPASVASGMAAGRQAAFSHRPARTEITRPIASEQTDAYASPEPVMTVWPPAPIASIAMPGNTSGTDGPLPTEVAAKKWHWGACSLSWLWLIFHKKPALGIITLLVGFVPIAGGLIGLVMALHFGVNGHKIAWQSRRFESVDAFFAVQNKWSLWGTAVTAATALLIVGCAAWCAYCQQPAWPPMVP